MLSIEMAKIEFAGGHIGIMLIIEMAKINKLEAIFEFCYL